MDGYAAFSEHAAEVVLTGRPVAPAPACATEGAERLKVKFTGLTQTLGQL
jgi:hypothetical protein